MASMMRVGLSRPDQSSATAAPAGVASASSGPIPASHGRTQTAPAAASQEAAAAMDAEPSAVLTTDMNNSQSSAPSKKRSAPIKEEQGYSMEWTDEYVQIVCSLIVEQVGQGNRPNTHLNPLGYNTVSERFYQMTGISLSKTQLKNKWDKLKGDWSCWNKLMRKQTGTGWDSSKGVIVMDNEWWKKARKMSDSDSDDSDDESNNFWNIVLGASIRPQVYCDQYLDKNPPRTSILSGMGWLQETLRTPGDCLSQLRMSTEVFVDLHDLLVRRYGLEPSMHVSTYESLAIFLFTCGGNESNRRGQNRFKHSSETISRKFDEVLNCLMKMAKDFITPKNPNFPTVHKRIRDDKRAYPHYKDCIGALDGTHILVSLSPEDSVRYIGKSGIPLKMFLQFVTLTCYSLMCPWGNQGLCMTLVCYTMHYVLMKGSSHTLQKANTMLLMRDTPIV